MTLVLLGFTKVLSERVTHVILLPVCTVWKLQEEDFSLIVMNLSKSPCPPMISKRIG